MKINFNQKLESFDGKEVGILKQFCIEPLLATFPDEQNLAGEEKLRRFLLASKIHWADGEAELMAEEISLVKKLIGKGYGPLVVGQAWKMLEGGK